MRTGSVEVSTSCADLDLTMVLGGQASYLSLAVELSVNGVNVVSRVATIFGFLLP